jgi:hypothetical protein
LEAGLICERPELLQKASSKASLNDQVNQTPRKRQATIGTGSYGILAMPTPTCHPLLFVEVSGILVSDWAATPEPVPYADLTDPQSLNQYSYVRNIPTSKVDPDGHDCPQCPAIERFLEEVSETLAGQAIIQKGAQIAGAIGTGAGGWMGLYFWRCVRCL